LCSVKITGMKNYFFKDLASLDQFTMELDRHQDSLKCRQCTKNDQFVSHGYVYRQLSSTSKAKVGKRIFCSNRHGRTGCGSTLRLYLTEAIPSLRYQTVHLAAFLNTLLGGASIQQSYQTATQTTEPRNAYRWLNKLDDQLINYHGFLKTRAQEFVSSFRSRTRRLQILLPSIRRLSVTLSPDFCRAYQLVRQAPII